jgi:hypothetical protein
MSMSGPRVPVSFAPVLLQAREPVCFALWLSGTTGTCRAHDRKVKSKSRSQAHPVQTAK